MKAEKFNLRVYGIWIRDNYVLLSEEQINDFCYIQFPGGGVELGEGILDALKREWIEETGVEISDYQHYYTTDFFQVSAFNPGEQLISIFYKVLCNKLPVFLEKDESTFTEHKKLKLRWQPLLDFNFNLLTFEDGKKVGKLISV